MIGTRFRSILALMVKPDCVLCASRPHLGWGSRREVARESHIDLFPKHPRTAGITTCRGVALRERPGDQPPERHKCCGSAATHEDGGVGFAILFFFAADQFASHDRNRALFPTRPRLRFGYQQAPSRDTPSLRLITLATAAAPRHKTPAMTPIATPSR